LTKPKLDRYLTEQERGLFVSNLLNHAQLVQLPAVIPRICRDPNDDHLLALALAGGATVLVTGDADLLVLHPWQGIHICTPQDFLSLLPNT
jgi:putative PIN family toxin of toxin-antitoxin system